MRNIALSLATALILLSSSTANAVLNMGGKTIFTGTLIEILEPGSATQIQDIIDNITDASATKPYLIHLGPGVYDLGTTNIVMKEWVSLQGSGQKTTKIIGDWDDAFSGLLIGADNTALTDLTIENRGGANSVAIYNWGASPRIVWVTAIASGGNYSYGVRNRSSSSPTMTNVTVNASGVVDIYGVDNSNSSPTMTNVTVNASDGSSGCYGVRNDSSSPVMSNVTTTASGCSSSNYGIVNKSSSSPTMTNVTAKGTGGSTGSYGIYNYFSSSPFIKDSIIEGGTFGLHIRSDSAGTRVVNSKIIGNVEDQPTGTTQCLGNYDGSLGAVDC